MTRLICLANSWRPGGRCVAGIDPATGQWVRPTPPTGVAIPEEYTWVKGRFIAPLDVIQMDLEAPTLATRFQCENQKVQNWDWRRVGTAEVGYVLRHCSKGSRVLHSAGKTVEPCHLERLPPPKWTSLELIHTKDLAFEPDPRKPDRWQAGFSVGKLGPEYCLNVTDPVATRRLNDGEKIASACLLTVSLTEPIEFSQYGKPPLCYKLVAAVIEL